MEVLPSFFLPEGKLIQTPTVVKMKEFITGEEGRYGPEILIGFRAIWFGNEELVGGYFEGRSGDLACVLLNRVIENTAIYRQIWR